MRYAQILLLAGVTVATACDGAGASAGVPSAPPEPAATFASVSANFELLGGYRLQSDFASEGLALVRDVDGYVTEAIVGANAQTNSVHVFDLRTALGGGPATITYPELAPLRTWRVDALFPRWIAGQTLRDMTAVVTPAGYELAGVGRVFYNTSPRATTQISIRELQNNGMVLGPAREIPVDLPEQEFSGFIKHMESKADLGAIGAGAYDSGQGSVAGLSYAIQSASGGWIRLLNPPPFGDITAPRLPRDAEYSCPEGASWVCLPPVGDKGVWSTERIGGGGVRFGNTVMFIATLGYGDRRYSRQSYTFGDPSQDRAVAYFYAHDGGAPQVKFVGYDRWSFAAPGQPVIGVALGKLRGTAGQLLFVLTANAWENGRHRVSPILQVFRIKTLAN